MSYFPSIRITDQNINVDASNSYTGTIAIGAVKTLTPSGVIPITSIQLYVSANVNLLIEIGQADTAVNCFTTGTVQDKFNYFPALNNGAFIVTSVAPFFCVRITNLSTLAIANVVVLAATVPILSTLPHALSSEGNFKVGVYEIEGDLGVRAEVTPNNEQRVSMPVRLIGATFLGNTLDTSYWTPFTAGSVAGSVSQASGIATMIAAAGSTPVASSAAIQSVRTARYVSGSALVYQGVAKLPVALGVSTRRWGAFTTTDGFFFEHDGTNLSLVCRTSATNFTFTVSGANASVGARYSTPNGSIFTVLTSIAAGATLICLGTAAPNAAPNTLTKITGTGDATIAYSAQAASDIDYNKVTSGAFNGAQGATYVITPEIAYTFKIHWTTRKAWFIINDEVIHSFVGNIEPLSSVFSLPVRMECNNAVNNPNVNYYSVRSGSIRRFGLPNTRPQWFNQNNANTAATILKRSAGTLQKIVINSWADGSTVIVYDALTATNIIASIANVAGTQGNRSPVTIWYDLDFYTALCWTVTGTINVTIVWE
jgi:hypothetical protein